MIWIQVVSLKILHFQVKTARKVCVKIRFFFLSGFGLLQRYQSPVSRPSQAQSAYEYETTTWHTSVTIHLRLPHYYYPRTLQRQNKSSASAKTYYTIIKLFDYKPNRTATASKESDQKGRRPLDWCISSHYIWNGLDYSTGSSAGALDNDTVCTFASTCNCKWNMCNFLCLFVWLNRMHAFRGPGTTDSIQLIVTQLIVTQLIATQLIAVSKWWRPNW
jgi:hypothetical protein